MSHYPGLIQRPSTWFLITSIIVLVALLITYFITKQAGAVFWTVFVVTIIIFIWSLIVFIYEMLGSSKKNSSHIKINDTTGWSSIDDNGSSLKLD